MYAKPIAASLGDFTFVHAVLEMWLKCMPQCRRDDRCTSSSFDWSNASHSTSIPFGSPVNPCGFFGVKEEWHHRILASQTFIGIEPILWDIALQVP